MGARIGIILSPIHVSLANQARKAVQKIILGEEGLLELMTPDSIGLPMFNYMSQVMPSIICPEGGAELIFDPQNNLHVAL